MALAYHTREHGVSARPMFVLVQGVASVDLVELSIDDTVPPDLFVQMPPTQTNKISKLRFMTDPLPHDTLVAGPAVLNFFASIDQTDTNWISISQRRRARCVVQNIEGRGEGNPN